ncbi:unnamed protein product, partial [Amoebophrya sp. A25]
HDGVVSRAATKGLLKDASSGSADACVTDSTSVGGGGEGGAEGKPAKKEKSKAKEAVKQKVREVSCSVGSKVDTSSKKTQKKASINIKDQDHQPIVAVPNVPADVSGVSSSAFAVSSPCAATGPSTGAEENQKSISGVPEKVP